MDGNRIVINRVDDENTGCCGVEISYGKTLIVLDPQHNCARSTRFDLVLERTIIFDSNLHCNHKQPNETESCESISSPAQ